MVYENVTITILFESCEEYDYEKLVGPFFSSVGELGLYLPS